MDQRADLYICKRHCKRDIWFHPSDMFCPFTWISRSCLDVAPRPFVASNLHPSLGVGVSVWQSRNIIVTPSRWNDIQASRYRDVETKARKNGVIISEARFPKSKLPMETARRICSHIASSPDHLEREITELVNCRDAESFMVLEGRLGDGSLLFEDLSVVTSDFVYGVSCVWNHAFKRLSPGILSCVVVAKRCEEMGLPYNLGCAQWKYKEDMETGSTPNLGVVLLQDESDMAIVAEFTGWLRGWGATDVNRY